MYEVGDTIEYFGNIKEWHNTPFIILEVDNTDMIVTFNVNGKVVRKGMRLIRLLKVTTVRQLSRKIAQMINV